MVWSDTWVWKRREEVQGMCEAGKLFLFHKERKNDRNIENQGKTTSE